MGSAAQPRSGTAPKAPAANAVFRKLRRLGRLAKDFDAATTNRFGSLFMPSSPYDVRDPALPSALLFLVTDASAPEICIQYGFVVSRFIAADGASALASGPGLGLPGCQLVDLGLHGLRGLAR